MRRMSWEEFRDFYESRGRMPHQLQKPNRPLNDRQLEKGYEKYLRSIEKQEDRLHRAAENQKRRNSSPNTDTKWEHVREGVFLRDGYSCQLIEILNGEELRELKRRAGQMIHMTDPAHIIPRNVAPELRYDPDNIVTLNRYSHSLLDSFHHPIFGHPISREERDGWWRRIVGRKHYDYLQSQRRKTNGEKGRGKDS